MYLCEKIIQIMHQMLKSKITNENDKQKIDVGWPPTMIAASCFQEFTEFFYIKYRHDHWLLINTYYEINKIAAYNILHKIFYYY